MRGLSVVGHVKGCVSPRMLYTSAFVSTGSLCNRSARLYSSQPEPEVKSTTRPYANIFNRIINPVGYFRWEALRIDESREVYLKCSSQLEKNVGLIEKLGMNKDYFRTWFAMTILHVWLVNLRFKAEGLPGKDATQELFNHIWIDADIRLNKAGVKARVGKVMEDLVDSYYGQSLAYAEGLVKGDAILASAMWRNFFAQSPETKPSDLLFMTAYVRMQLAHLSQLSKEKVMSGRFDFLPWEQVQETLENDQHTATPRE